MAETRTTGAPADAGIDLTQFFQVFFEEAGDNLEAMERRLLELDVAAADDEELNAIFRCAHSVKGGAATFGFADVAALTHQMETLLDKLRRHELAPTAAMVDVLLAAGDALRGLLARHQGGGGAEIDTADLLQSIRALCVSGQANAVASARPACAAAAGVANAPPPASDASAPAAGAANARAAGAAGAPAHGAGALSTDPALRVLELSVGALADPSQADGLVELFQEIDGLGTIEPLPSVVAGDGRRRFKVTTNSSDSDLLDLFTFHVPREAVCLAPLVAAADIEPIAPAALAHAPPDLGYGFFADAPDAPDAPGAPGPTGAAADGHAPPPAGAAVSAPMPRAATARKAEARPGTALDSTTLRVAVEKVDQLINLVGELVITQAMLAQHGKSLDTALKPALAAGLADLERNTRDLQEAVMSIRMIPMSLVFNRFPRMLRDLAAKLGKQVDLVTQGEATELDKGMIERITDPLTHLVRNSADHGIEPAAERVARGKPERGTITLVAAHQGGSIVIEVRDDGRGLNRDKLLKKAREKGLAAPDTMTDAEVWNLILAPGFSTAEVVTDVSGRGVGMDVVKKNISALGGSVEIDSADGYGMSVKVRLPLTLAIMDGMSVGVGDECYILPLGAVIESFQLRPGMIRTLGASAHVVEVRGEYLPVLDLERLFDVPRVDPEPASPIVVVVEAEGGRVALRVDALLGQQQVVVKNLEANYRKVPDVSGATIMGDGRVALILDAGALVRRCRH